MKRILIIGILTCLVIKPKAQTVEETKSWILSKLNKYQEEFFGVKLKGDCDSYARFNNFSSVFQQDTLVVSFDAAVLFPDCFRGNKEKDRKELARKAVTKIPVSDISKISTFDNGRRFRIHTSLSTMRMIATFDSGTVVSYTNICSIGFNFSTEELLFERFQKAFNHLVSFYPKKENKESF